MGQKHTLRRVTTVVVCCALVAVAVWAWRTLHTTSPPTKAAAPAGVPVQVVEVAKTNFPVLVLGLGTVMPNATVQVRARVDGQIEKMFFKEGDLVKQGQLLVQLDARPYQAALDQATAKQSQDQANLNNANLDLQRYADLVKRGDTSRQQYDTQQSTVNQLQALVRADEGALANAQTMLSYTQISAPLNGRTSFINIDVGNIVHSADTNPMFTIAQVQPISVVFTAPEGGLPDLYAASQKGQVDVQVMTAGNTTPIAKGTLTTINNQVDVATGTIQLKATFANTDNALWPGLSVTTQTLVKTLDDVVVVPASAIQHGPNNSLFSYVVQDGKAQIRQLEIAQMGHGQGVINKGLQAGDVVVVAGQYRLKVGSPVTIQKPGTDTTVEKQPAEATAEK